MKESDLSSCGKCIRTQKGNLLVCFEIYGKQLYFYMDPNGLRLPSAHETKRGMYMNEQEWNHALRTWPGAKEEELHGWELKKARDLALILSQNFCFGMSDEQILHLPKNHFFSFK